jgi:DNA polymerase/3'-5' exonuclease PolX
MEFYPLALLYFTGSEYFNRRMRYIAEKKGFHLGSLLF